MTYFMVPDELPMRMIAAGVSIPARWTYVVLGTYTARFLKDGLVDVPLSLLSDDEGAEGHVDELVDAGFVERVEGGLLLPYFLDHNKDAAAMGKMRDAARLRKRRWELHQGNDHSLCTDRCTVRKPHDAGDHSRCTSEWCDALGNVPENVPGTLRNASLYDTDYDIDQRRDVVVGGKGQGSSDGRAALARVEPASDLESRAHVCIDVDFTAYCAACDLGRSNRVHQKVPAKISASAVQLHRAGVTKIRITEVHDSGETIDGEALFDDCELALQWSRSPRETDDDLQLTWIEARLPADLGWDIPGDWVDIRQEMDAACARLCHGVQPITDHEPEFDTVTHRYCIPLAARDERGLRFDLTDVITDALSIIPAVVAILRAAEAEAA